jgi:hypothetical protein
VSKPKKPKCHRCENSDVTLLAEHNGLLECIDQAACLAERLAMSVGGFASPKSVKPLLLRVVRAGAVNGNH